jgi:glycosyltransferase involved in cell wall biosynthesis
MSLMKYSISIIVPIYNAVPYIERCARSLFEQDMADLEYIFVNDCTPDNSVELLKQLINDEFPDLKERIVIVDLDTNAGVANARNIGLDNAHGEYIGFCDSDDWIEKNMYSSLYKKAKETGAEIVGCNMVNEYQDASTVFIQNYGEDKQINISHLLLGSIFPSLCTEIVKRSLYVNNNIRFISGINMGEDLLVNTQLYVNANDISFVAEPFYHYRHDIDSSCEKRNLSSVMSDIKVASLIEEYLVKKDMAICLMKEMNFRKFFSKLPLWTSKEYRDVKTWRNTFPDSNRYIFEYEQLDWKMKVEYWLVANRLVYFAKCFVILLLLQNRLKVRTNKLYK